MATLQQFLALIHANAAFAGPLSFVVAFLGCTLVTNLFVPAGAILTAMGVLTGSGVLSWTFGPWAVCGAVLGMSTSYAVGRHLGTRVQNIPVLHARPQLILRASRLFEQYGFTAILIGYYSGPLRALIASAAAIAGMPRGKFEFANIASALVWTTCSIAIGALPGTWIPSDSYWLPVGVVLIPAVTIGISLVIILIRPRKSSLP